MNTIQLNKYVNLHDGEKIFYTKYEYFYDTCELLKKRGHDVVLIIGGRDNLT
jgi:hypothetical protein